MMNSNHPDDELLAAFAGADPDATGDRAVSEHLAACAQCTAIVDDLRSLTAALAELPDLAPRRPLRFLPPAAQPRRARLVDRVGGVVRGIFVPALTAGAALALVGAVGTLAPSLEGASGGGAAFEDVEDTLQGAPSSDATAAEPSGGDERGAAEAAGSPEPTDLYLSAVGPSPTAEAPAAEAQRAPRAAAPDQPIWPIVLISGVALIVVMVFLRWILAPRAG
jgi:hypothetical protein